MGRKKMRHLSGAEFDAVMLLVKRMSADRRAAARAALVDGMTAQAVADQYGWKRSAVNNAESVIWSVYQLYLRAKLIEAENAKTVPKGWARETLPAPKAMLSEFKDAVAAAGSTTTRRARN